MRWFDDAYQKYWRYQRIVESVNFGIALLIAVIAVYIGGPIVLACFIWKQIKVEKWFYDRYGQAWQEEYQKYHSSLADAHLRIAISAVALISIMVIGFWFYRQTHKRKMKRSRGA